MKGEGHLKRAALLAALLAGTGCSYGMARIRDFTDIFRVEVHGGYGLQGHVVAGEFIHVGLGTSTHWSAGLVYGRWESGRTVEDHFPVAFIRSLAQSEQENLHRLDIGKDAAGGTHRCYWIFPGVLNPGTVEKPPIHYFDIEAGFLAGFFGFEFGFSPGELLDWLLGLFKLSDEWTFLDPAGDDGSKSRDGRRLWIPRQARDTLQPPP